MEQAQSFRALKALGLLLLSTATASAPALAEDAGKGSAPAGPAAPGSAKAAPLDTAEQVRQVEGYAQLKASIERLTPEAQTTLHRQNHAARLAKPLAERAEDRRIFIATLYAKPKAERVELMRAAYEVEIAERAALEEADKAVWYTRYYDEIQALTDTEASALRKLVREVYDASSESYRKVMLGHANEYAAQMGPDCCGKTDEEIGLPFRRAPTKG